ncbi:MAG TPA: hypothetical protein VFI06_01080 [Chitinophagaceae bacterium]|nr:hypothetical protein [Chitinophagaceae bacterium]
MKRIAIALNALLVGIIVIQACNSNNNKRSLCPDPCGHCKSYNDNDQIPGEVRGDVIQILSDAYKEDYPKSHITGTEIQPNDPHNLAKVAMSRDALSLVFDLEKIKNLVWKMEQAICANQCGDSVKLGIRFYYVKYSVESLAKIPVDIRNSIEPAIRANPNKHALVMVPVFKRSTDNEWYDFDFRGVSSPCKFALLSGTNWTEFSLGTGILGGGDNHGGVGPPPDPGTYPTNQPPQP